MCNAVQSRDQMIISLAVILSNIDPFFLLVNKFVYKCATLALMPNINKVLIIWVRKQASNQKL